jgi:hypothetical protein
MRIPIKTFREKIFNPEAFAMVQGNYTKIAQELQAQDENEREKLAFQILGALNRNHLEDGEYESFVTANAQGTKPSPEWLATLIVLTDVLKG